MTAARPTIVGLVLIVGILHANYAVAQQPGGKRSVSRPTLSPYLNQYRTELGIHDPYSLLSRPNPSTTTRTKPPLTTTYGSTLNSTLPRSPEVTRNRDRMLQQKALQIIAPTGVNSSYMNTGHFYPISPRARR